MAAAASRVSSWYAKLSSFSVEALFSRKREPGPPRTVFINQDLPAEYLNHRGRVKPSHVYTSNQVITSKYTIITFIPRNLLEQFRRIANIYFLAISILQFFPEFSTISPGVVILPLIIILALTALKDGYEDYKRHQSDTKVNYGRVKVLAGSDWKNPNAMKGKSKTFIRGLVQTTQKITRPGRSGRKNNHDVEYDYDDSKPTDAYWQTSFWEDVCVGDFVKIMEDNPIPADILICATSDEEENVAFVETKNLDGETNLKSRNAVPGLTHLRTAADCADKSNSFHVNCDRPENNMYRLNANVDVNGGTVPVDLQTTLLRGTVLRNTAWVIGVVLFTGEDTKIVMNAGGTPSKRSKVERQMNPQVLINLLIMALLAVVCAIADSSLEKHYYPLNAPWLFGDNRSGDNPNINGIITWAFGILTFQDIVPISLYLSIEVVRTLQAAWIYFDKDIWYEKTNQATLARSWNLSDDLGQIQYIFSDKTGTLTQNVMVFRQCSIGGKAYRGDVIPDSDDDENLKKRDLLLEKIEEQGENSFDSTASGSNFNITRKDDSYHFHDSALQADIDEALSENPNPEFSTHARSLNGFFTVLALCHTVIASHDSQTGAIKYKAQSPDEAALVQAAADMGFVFLGREKEILSMQTPSSTDVEQFELLNILEFTSARKRMSVILRKLNDDNRIFLLSKGADNVIFERLKTGLDELKEVTERHLGEFANDGLRTLTLGYKVISEEEYNSWRQRYYEATIAMDDRESKIESVSDEIERDLRLLGATAIEDRLQDGVPEAIADLKRAGVKVWVATGDKLETAIAIGRSTNLIGVDSNIIIVRGGSRPVEVQMANAIEQFFPENMDDDLQTLARHAMPRPSLSNPGSNDLRRVNTGISSIVGPENGDRPGGFVLVVDGSALLQAFANEKNKTLLLRLGMLCEGVICCRVSPLQKALIVKMVKDGIGAMTLAIGDGANDVSMIQAADVGVGISGEEGLQAVNSSDYAIGQFRFLKKLLLVHGHWSYSRNAIMILNFFYKNIVPTSILWWFQIYCGWSAPFAFDYTYILLWNSVWTIAPVVGLGLFDRFLDSEVLMELPELYHYGREAYWFGTRQFFVYMFDGVVQSVAIYFIIMYAYWSTSGRSDGYDVAQYEWTTTAAIASVMAVDLFTGMSATAWTGWIFFAVFLGIVIIWAYTFIYTSTLSSFILYGNYFYLGESALFWLSIPLTIVIALAPRYIAKAFKFGYWPDDLDTVRWIRKFDHYRDLSGDNAHGGIGLSEMRRRRRTSSVPPSRRSSRVNSVISLPERSRPSMDVRCASRTDMSTGLVSVERGFDFATEEQGVAMRRIQSNLSERWAGSSRNPHQPEPESKKGKERGHLFSLKRIKKRR